MKTKSANTNCSTQKKELIRQTEDLGLFNFKDLCPLSNWVFPGASIIAL